jgi:hypothetical protein
MFHIRRILVAHGHNDDVSRRRHSSTATRSGSTEERGFDVHPSTQSPHRGSCGCSGRSRGLLWRVRLVVQERQSAQSVTQQLGASGTGESSGHLDDSTHDGCPYNHEFDNDDHDSSRHDGSSNDGASGDERDHPSRWTRRRQQSSDL